MATPLKILVPFDGSKESDRAFRKAMELAKLIRKGGTGVEVSMLYVVHELIVPNRLFDHDLDIKSKITGERLTAMTLDIFLHTLPDLLPYHHLATDLFS